MVYGFDEACIYGLREEGHAAQGWRLRALEQSAQSPLIDFGTLFESVNESGDSRSLRPVGSTRTWLGERELARRQITSGNIGIDFTNPIYEGSFSIVRTSPATEHKRDLLLQSIRHLNPDLVFLHLSFKKQKSEKILTLFGPEVSGVHSFLLAGGSKSELFLCLKALVLLLEAWARQGKRVLLLLDDLVDAFHELFNFYHFSRNEVFLSGGSAAATEPVHA